MKELKNNNFSIDGLEKEMQQINESDDCIGNVYVLDECIGNVYVD